MKVSESLQRAKGLLEKPDHWFPGYDKATPAQLESFKLRKCHCMLTAIAGDNYQPCLNLLYQAIRKIDTSVKSELCIAYWNDDNDHSKVVEVITTAIELAIENES